MNIIDRVKRIVTRQTIGQLSREVARRSHFELSTRGGIVVISADFSICYKVDGGQPCRLSQPRDGTTFTLTLVQSPSGSGKTTLLRELYAHIHRHGNASKLNFDFHPDYTNESRIACGFIPQHPPFVKHWRCDSLLPKKPSFVGVFFPEFSDQERLKLASKRVGQLSGGQVRRMLACSALEELHSDNQSASAFLLLDETFDGIGAQSLVSCLHNLRSLWQSLATKPLHLLLVTHLNLNEMRESLVAGDLAVAMTVTARSCEALETTLRNQEW